MSHRRVVVTGLGTVNPLANNVKGTWDKLVRGESGVRRIKTFDASEYTSQIGGELQDFDFTKHFTAENVNRARKLDPFVHYAQAATHEALAMAGLGKDNTTFPRDRIGICVGSGIGGLHTQIKQTEAYMNKGHKRVSPFYIPALIGNIASGFVSMEEELRGPNLSTQTACATGNHSIGTAFFILQNGMAEAMVCGGTEATILGICFAGFGNMKALSTGFNNTPEKASRPFDKKRDGFIIAEGAGVLVLEEYESAKKRGADIYCEVLSVGMTGDAYDLVAPHPDGEGAYRSIKMSLDMAKVAPEKVDYINAHATSTPQGDVAECRAIRRALGDNQKNVHVGSTKSMTGHLLGAASGIEAVICALSIRNSVVPPTINIEELDPETGMTCINTQPVQKKVNIAISNSFGFGGHNSTLCLSKI